MPELRTDTKGLKKLMIDADLNQTQLAVKAGISIPAVASIINGSTKPNLKTIQKLAFALGRPTNEVCEYFTKEGDE